MPCYHLSLSHGTVTVSVRLARLGRRPPAPGPRPGTEPGTQSREPGLAPPEPGHESEARVTVTVSGT